MPFCQLLQLVIYRFFALTWGGAYDKRRHGQRIARAGVRAELLND